MYFMDDERLREYERFMQHTPHYRPRGCGVIGIRIMDTKPPPAPYEERMDKWLLIFHSNPFGCG